MHYHRIVTSFLGTPWAILPSKFNEIAAVLSGRVAGIPADVAAIERAIEAQAQLRDRHTYTIGPSAINGQSGARGGAVAVIPVYGTIAQRMDLMSAMSGGASTESLKRQIREAVADPSVGSIVLDIDSPGGSVFGVQELSDVIFEARQHKRIVAVANSLAASAAYWIGSAADEFVVTPGGQVGSVGVIVAHQDYSAFVNATEAGMAALPAYTFIVAGQHKADGNFAEPLSDETRAFIQSTVDDYYRAFVDTVARNRGISSQQVVDGFGQGRTFGAQEAFARGMVDDVETFDDVIARLTARPAAAGGGRRPAGQRAEADIDRARVRGMKRLLDISSR